MASMLAGMFPPERRFLSSKEIMELVILEFYHNVFQQEGCESRRLRKALKLLRSAYSKESINSTSSAVTFESPDMRCAYLFHFAPCFASAVACHFHDVLFFNPWLLEKILLRDALTLACLGGGPATELVAVVKVLEDMFWWYCPRSGRPLTILATIVDADSGWKDTVQKVGSSLRNLSDPSMIQCQVSFVQADLTEPFSERVKEILGTSDVVTMVKFLTAVQGSVGRNGISNSLQNIVQHIQENGMLFFLDSSGFQHQDLLWESMMSSDSMIQIYGPWGDEFHEMSSAFDIESSRLYFKHFQKQKCCIRSRNFVSAWYRIYQWYR